jgi:predicted phosphodiesterase
MANWDAKTISPNVHRICCELDNNADELWSLHISDVHWDNPKCDRALFKRHLDEALELNCPVFIYGDFFCAMQGKYDPRRNKEAIRPEHNTGDYLDRLVETAADYLEPYAQNIVLITEGNHESSIRKNLETDLLDRLCGELRHRDGITTKGGYQGWVQWQTTTANRRNGFQLYYHHGSGGGAPVTKGAIDFNRMAEQVVADVYISGHIHRLNHNRQEVMSLTRTGRQVLKVRDYVRTSTYKQEGEKAHGWAVERRMGPRPLGGYWLRLQTYKHDNNMRTIRTWIPTSY